jgi:hypothetical protein
MEKRMSMMQSWADYLDGLKTEDNIIPINKRAV